MSNLTRMTTALAVIAIGLPSAMAQDDDDVPQIIRVTGEGRATAPPDMATIHTGVSSQAEDARTALDQNNAAMERLLAVLTEREIAKKDVQTSNFSVSPVYRHDQDDQGRTESKVVGYRVENQIHVRVRDLDSLGTILDALVSAGSNQISGINFGIDDESEVLNEARRKAITNARERAQVYAKTANVVVGPIIQINEHSAAPPQPMRTGRMAFAAEAASVPIATGEQEFRVTIEVVYKLEQRNGE